MGATNTPGQGRKADSFLIAERRRLGYSEIMSTTEIDEVLSRAKEVEYLGLKGESWECLFAVFWAYGKRVSEVVELRTTDIVVREGFLLVSFRVRKKRGDKRLPRRTKRLTLKNKYAKIIRDYWEKRRVLGGYLFPRIQTASGHIYPKYVWDVISMMEFKQPIWTHLFRHSLATELANADVSAFEMRTWFDWEKIDTADAYVSAAGVSTKKVSARKW